MGSNRVEWGPIFAGLCGIAVVLFALSAMTKGKAPVPTTAERIADVEARVAKIEERLQEGAYRMGELDADGRELLHLLRQLEGRIAAMEGKPK